MSEWIRKDDVLKLIYDLSDMTTADVRENIKGEWKREVLGSTSGYGTTVMYQCSACERMSISEYHYCPNCGADMRSRLQGTEIDGMYIDISGDGTVVEQI